MVENTWYLVICAFSAIALFPQPGRAQFEFEPLSVALDNTKYQCTSNKLVAKNDTFTKGGSSVGYAPNRPPGITSAITCHVSGASKVTFDWRLIQARPSDRIEFQSVDQFGREVIIASLSSNSDWTTKTALVPQEARFIRWTFWDQGGDAWVDNVRVKEVSPYSAALDNYDIEVFTTGNQHFSTTTEFMTKGDKSVVSGSINDSEQSILFALVDGSQLLTFDWRVSSERGFDGLVFNFLDQAGNLVGDPLSISGELGWESVRLEIPGPEPHFLVWGYVKDNIISRGRDSGWIDNLRVGGTALSFLPGLQLLLLESEDP